MVAWSIRGLSAGRLGGGAAEAAFCIAAQGIRKMKISTVEEILSNPEMDRLIPNDRGFQADFSEWRVMRGALARYILRALELEQRGVPEPELVVNPDVRQVNLEHILPKSPREGEWTTFSDEDQRLFVHRLGNMALLQQGANGRIGNKPWTIKRPILSASDLHLTQEAGLAMTWDADAIEKRQESMAALAVKAWPRRPR